MSDNSNLFKNPNSLLNQFAIGGTATIGESHELQDNQLADTFQEEREVTDSDHIESSGEKEEKKISRG